MLAYIFHSVVPCLRGGSEDEERSAARLERMVDGAGDNTLRQSSSVLNHTDAERISQGLSSLGCSSASYFQFILHCSKFLGTVPIKEQNDYSL